jgi:hypothetical protein
MSETELVRALIEAFVVREECCKAIGDTDAARGIRECITHLQDYMTYHLEEA